MIPPLIPLIIAPVLFLSSSSLSVFTHTFNTVDTYKRWWSSDYGSPIILTNTINDVYSFNAHCI